MKRIGSTNRDTLETRIRVEANIDGTGSASLSTGLPFFEHMQNQQARYTALSGLYDDLGGDPSQTLLTLEDLNVKIGKVKTAINARDYQAFAI